MLPDLVKAPWLSDFDDAHICEGCGRYNVTHVSGCLSTSVWVTGEGRRIIADFVGRAELPKVWVDRIQIHCSLIEAHTPGTQMIACVLVAAAWYVQLQWGFMLYWSLPGTAKAAQLPTCRHGIGRWRRKGWASWQKMCADMQFPGQFHNAQQSENSVAKEGRHDPGALRFTSASTGALLRLWATWTYSSHEQGGFAAVEVRPM